MNKTSAIVIDASPVVILVLGMPFAEDIRKRWQSWIDQDIQIFVPCLWANEVTSAIHKVLMQGGVSEAKALEALQAVQSLGVHIHSQDAEMCLSAFNWATRLGQLAAYDSFYLALAESLQAEFWTADKRLVDQARQVGVIWVHEIGE